MKAFSYTKRSEYLQQLQNEKFDLIIIGGGINGAGTARDAALRGMKVALVDAKDFASGTSSKSSKLIHGGIRYLENMDFHLVFEALNERSKLFEMAPHLVHPLRFMLPLYESSRVGMFKMGLGMWLYDALSLFQAPELHERLSSKESMERMPTLREKELVGSYVYSDAYMDDDRLVHETLRAAVDAGAVCVSYVKAGDVKFNSENKIEAVKVTDSESKKEFWIQGSHVISAVGPWTDQVRSELFKEKEKILRPTKGIHLTLSKSRLPLTSAVVMAAEKSDRIVFGIPRHEMVIIGTTDTDYKEDPSDVSVTEDDVKYLFEVTEHYFPGAKLTKDDIIASYAGVRPLVHDGSSSEGKTSREHTILQDPRGVTYVAGGKYTTYRLMTEQVVDKALKAFSLEDRVRFRGANTVAPLNEWTSVEAYDQSLNRISIVAEQTHRDEDFVRRLTERYGGEVLNIIMDSKSDWSYWQTEANQAINSTFCGSLLDFYTRRVPLYLAVQDHGLSLLSEISEVFKTRLKWSDEKTHSEMQKVRDFVKTDLAWKSALR